MIDYESGSAGGIAYSVINDGGGGDTDGNSDYVYAELVIEGVNISVSHSQFENSYGNGIEITQGANPTLTSDSFTYTYNSSSSSGYAVVYDFVPGNLTGALNGLSSTGYGYNDVEIGSGGGPGSFSGTGTWPQAGIPYRTGIDVQVSSGATLTIAAGVTVLMDGTNLYAESGSTLNLSGTSGSMVTLTSSHDIWARPAPTSQATGEWWITKMEVREA